MTQRIKIYGMPRTGTTWMYETIKCNFSDAEPLGEEYGNKHREPTDAARKAKVNFVVCIKNPLAWVASIKRLSQHKGVAERFCGVSVEDWVKTYNGRYHSWRSLDPNRTVIVRNEDAIEEPYRVMNRMRRIAKQWHGFAITEACGWNSDVFDPTYYTERRYLDDLADEEIDLITRTADWRLLSMYGYEEEVRVR